jgi:hypothetical protein
MTKENVIANVQASLGSLFTKDDVIACINMIQQEQPAPASAVATDYEFMFRHLKERVSDMAFEFDWEDKTAIAFDDLDFSINRNNVVELDDYTINATELKDNFLYDLKTLFDDIEQEHKTRMEIINENK